MKKFAKLMILLTLVAILATTLFVPAAAADHAITLEVGDTWGLLFSDTPYISSDTSVIKIRYDGDSKYTAVAVGEGTATVTGGTWANTKTAEYKFSVYDSTADAIIDQFDQAEGLMDSLMPMTMALPTLLWMLLVFALAGLIALLCIAEMIYIFIAAPKCGMSRLWALVPLFSNILGLIVFIIVRSKRKETGSVYTVTCPSCSSKHPEGTAVCSICGAKLQ